MTIPATTEPAATRAATKSQLDWLTGELTAWQAAGLLDETQGGAIRRQYRVSHLVPLVRLLLVLGACFVGAGLIWLVAANLDSLTPSTRFGLISALWIALLAGGELLDLRRRTAPGIPAALVEAVRLLAALVYGAVVFQAAQSLQVPAYEPTLVAAWAAGSLLHAYAVRAVAPLVVGVVGGLVWFLWVVADQAGSEAAFAIAMSAAAVVTCSAAAVHTRWLTEFALAWRELGAVFALAGLFVAAQPFFTQDGLHVGPWTVVLVLVVLACSVVVGLMSGRGSARFEPLGALAALAVATPLALWDTGVDPWADTGTVTAEAIAHSIVGVAAFVLAGVAVAALGIIYASWRLTAVSAAALVAFTVEQSYAVFGRIIDGAWLFVVLGLVLLAAGLAFDRTRRRLASALGPIPGGAR